MLGAEQGPRAAHKLIRENQLSALFVVDRQNTLRGVVYEDEVSRAVTENREDLAAILHREPMTVAPDTTVADLFGDAAESRAPLPVVGDGGRLLGVIPRVTLLNALSAGSQPAEAQEVAR